MILPQIMHSLVEQIRVLSNRPAPVGPNLRWVKQSSGRTYYATWSAPLCPYGSFNPQTTRVPHAIIYHVQTQTESVYLQ
jgi:hypothetical protein